MRIVLVRPEFSTKSTRPYPPFGLIALAPYFDAEVEIIDLQTEGRFHNVFSMKPDVIGFTGFSNQLKEIKSLTQIAKAHSKAKIVVGGPGVTIAPEYASSFLSDADLIVVGDGEYFAESFDEEFLEWWGDEIYRTERFNFQNHKIPTWHKIRYKQYFKYPGFAVETSRGCPFNCVWCSAHLVCGKKWRPRTPEDVVAELTFLKERYGARLFYFSDDNATVDPKRWVRLMRLIKDIGVNAEFHAAEGIQAHHLNRDTLTLMKQAGFRHITIGAESGVQRVLDKVIDKGGLKVEQTENVVRLCSEISINVSCYFVIGTAGETLDECEATVDFAEKLRGLGAYSCMVRNAIPIPGTRMFKIAKQKGFLTVPEEKLYDSSFIHNPQHLMKTPEWTPEQIMRLVAKAKRQDAKHLLRDKKTHLFKKGIVRLLTNPKAATKRLKQIITESRQQ